MARVDIDKDFCFEKRAKILEQYRKIIIGLDETGDALVHDLLTGVPYSDEGRKKIGKPPTLLMGAPGYGKTDSVVTIASSVDAKFSFIPFNPEIKISDLLGTDIYDPSSGKFYYAEGPVVSSHIVLADEINRGHPKAQACLLQVMEERKAFSSRMDNALRKIVSIARRLVPITDNPEEKRLISWIVGTGNPFEQEGTYPVPEAQLDRFTTCRAIELLDEEDEMKLRLMNVYNPDETLSPKVEKVTNLDEIYEMTNFIIKYVRPLGTVENDKANRMMQRLIQNSRPRVKGKEERRKWATPELMKLVDNYVKAGLSPRANFHFEAAARTLAFFRGRDHITVDDVKDIARVVMVHRIMLKPLARGRNIKQHDIVEKILEMTQAA